MPPLDPDVADLAPSDPALTAYDEQHAVTYMRLLDTDAEGADLRKRSDQKQFVATRRSVVCFVKRRACCHQV